jgi:hypothetical protein
MPAPVGRPGRGGVQLRQLTTTPTFISSVMIVSMAALAFGTTQVYMPFSSSSPAATCQVKRCARPDASHRGQRRVGGLPAVSPGTDRAQWPSPVPEADQPGRPPAPLPRPAVRVLVRVGQVTARGFSGVILVTGAARHVPSRWWLALSYPGVEITGMTGAIWERGRGATVVVKPLPGTEPLSTGRTPPIGFVAAGRPAVPSACLFDGERCHIVNQS